MCNWPHTIVELCKWCKGIGLSKDYKHRCELCKGTGGKCSLLITIH